MYILRLLLSAVILSGGAFYFASCLFAFSGHFRKLRETEAPHEMYLLSREFIPKTAEEI